MATDAVCFQIIDDKLHVLLAKTPKHSPFPGEWALIGGVLHPFETAEEAVDRLLKEKAGIEKIYKEQVYTFSTIDRDPRGRVVSIAYLTLTNTNPQDLSKAKLQTKWVPVSAVPKLAYDHNEMFEYVLKHLRFNLMNNDITRYLSPSEFTLSELQKIYEAVLGKKIDKRNFRKKIASLSILKPTKKVKKDGAMRPAKIFIFR